MSKIFFTPKVQLIVEDIRNVRILEGTVLSSQEVSLPRVVINGSLIFEGDDGKIAIKQLQQCGFYTDDQYKACITHFEKLMLPLSIPSAQTEK